ELLHNLSADAHAHTGNTYAYKQNPTSCKHMYCRYEHEHLRTDYAAAQPEQIRLTYNGWNIGFGTFRSACFHDGVYIGRPIAKNLRFIHFCTFRHIHIHEASGKNSVQRCDFYPACRFDVREYYQLG